MNPYDIEIQGYCYLKEKKNILKSKIEMAYSNLKELLPNLNKIESRIMNRELELRKEIVNISERTYKRDISLIKNDMNIIGKEINSNVLKSYFDNKNILKQRKKDIILKYELNYNDSKIKIKNLINKMETDFLKIDSLLNNIMEENYQIKNNYDKIKSKLFELKNKNEIILEKIRNLNSRKKFLFKKILLLKKQLNLLKIKIDLKNKDDLSVNLLSNFEENHNLIIENLNFKNYDESRVNKIKQSLSKILEIKNKKSSNIIINIEKIKAFHLRQEYYYDLIKENIFKIKINDENNKNFSFDKFGLEKNEKLQNFEYINKEKRRRFIELICQEYKIKEM